MDQPKVDGHTDASNPAAAKNSCFEIPEVPVLIIGGGPSGLLQSYLLSQLGVQSLIVERYPERLGAPKAHALSPRSLEICRQFGLDVREIRNLGTKRKDAFWVNFLTTLTGEKIGSLPYERMDPEVLEATPEMIHNIPQPVFERYVAEHLLKASNADIRKGISFVSLEQHANGVVTTVEERTTGHAYQIKSRFVIACDGARSKVRDCLGIKSDGEDSYETMMTIHFNANLRPIVGDRVGMLHWIFDPLAAGFIIAYDLSDNAVLISNFDADKYPIESWSEDLCKRVLEGAIGKDIEPRILSYRPWLLSRKVAQSYRNDNVFLAGDAAHSFPPTGGLGLNSGLADVHNLAFKIAAVLKGQADSSLLDTYDTERRHVAEVNSRQSVKNGKKIFGLLKTLGTASLSDLEEARASMFRVLHDPNQDQHIAAGIEEQREHFDNLNLHIGYVYGDKSIPSNASVHRPRFVRGARLPHVWIQLLKDTPQLSLGPIDVSYVSELSNSEITMRRYSSLDLCHPDAFTLILPGTTKEVTVEADAIRDGFRKLDTKLNTYHLDVDFRLVPTATSAEWRRNSGLTDGGGLLVRPDQHILYAMAADSTIDELLRTVTTFLGHS